MRGEPLCDQLLKKKFSSLRWITLDGKMCLFFVYPPQNQGENCEITHVLVFPRALHPILVSTSVHSSFCSKRHVTAEWTGTTPSTYLWSRFIMKWSVICWVMIRLLNLKWNKEKMVFLYLDSPKFKWTTLMNWMRYASFTEWLIDWPFDCLIDRCLSDWLIS